MAAIEKNNSDELSALLADLNRYGYCILRKVIPPEDIPKLRDSIMASVREHSTLPPPSGYVTGFLRVNQAIAPYLTNPRLMAIVDHLFGEFPNISMLTGTINGRGIPRGEVHADWPYNQNNRSRVRAPYPDVIMNLVTMWMITDYTVENGGTIIIPGSHKRDYAPEHGTAVDPGAKYEGEVQLIGKAGDVGVFDARTWHAIAPNISDHDRSGVIVRYAPWWINLNPLKPGTRERRQMVEKTGGQDSEVALLPQSIYENLPEDLKPLIDHLVKENGS